MLFCLTVDISVLILLMVTHYYFQKTVSVELNMCSHGNGSALSEFWNRLWTHPMELCKILMVYMDWESEFFIEYLLGIYFTWSRCSMIDEHSVSFVNINPSHVGPYAD